MIKNAFLLMIIAVVGMTACANHSAAISDQVISPRPYAPVAITLLSDHRGELPEYPVGADHANYRAYVEATPNEHYRIRVHNNSPQRVGVVIAVDGRNIINGKPSWLRNDERMYILEPYGRAEYDGWRTGANQVNRFYFTDAGNAYAAAFGDYSAMGVIAAAVYAERPRVESMDHISGGSRVPQAAARAESKAQTAPGTGYGETTYSPSQTVSFEPLPYPAQKVFLKYEWRSVLCAKRILTECRNSEGSENNRFWPGDNEYAPRR